MAEYCNCAGPMDIYNEVCGTCLKPIDNVHKPQNHHIIGKVYDVTAKNMNKLIDELDAKNRYIERLTAAMNKVIDMNLQEAEDRYGAEHRSRADSWSCVKVLREGLK